MKNPSRRRERKLRKDAREIFRVALKRCSPEILLRSNVIRRGNFLEGPGIRFDLGEEDPILVLAYGKASYRMARALRPLLSPRRTEGYLLLPPGPARRVPGLIGLSCAHPIPDRRSFRAGRLFLDRVERTEAGGRVIHLISGGGSALLASPLLPLITEQEKALLHRLLIGSNLGILEINQIRKHFSAIKAGRLLLRSPQARHLSLILSDVPEGPEAVAGGPTLPDPSTWHQCLAALRESELLSRLPLRLRRRLQRGGSPETPKPGDPAFQEHRWAILGSGENLLEAAAQRARELGYQVRLLVSPVEEPPEAALDRLGKAREDAGRERGGPFCIVAGGEVRVKARIRRGRGGRAQEFALEAARRWRNRREWIFLAAGSDGLDGNSPAAGALADGATLARARQAGLDAGRLRRTKDTYRLFKTLGDAVVTGPTGNNLRDLYLYLEGPAGIPGP